ncbi:MAG: DUF177 domain-containing protein [Peptococcaceae bacterium]|nr:DUF177 domain-containing protein [Peptococcaceae bacterium]
MKLNVAGLRRIVGGTENFFFREDFPPLQLGESKYFFQSPIEVHLTVNNTGKSLFVEGKINGGLEVLCSKCLKSFTYQMNFDFEDEFIPAKYYVESHDENDAFVFDKDEFSIDERIQEHILLHLPMRFICSDSCQGLCPQCGTDLNLNSCTCVDSDIDPRLAILSKWNKGVK